jgi:hypothetical protein
MGKSDKDHARQLLDMANKDHSALSHMRDSASFSDEVFGFHAQAYDGEDDIDRDEAIEKTRTFLAHVQAILDSTP